MAGAALSSCLSSAKGDDTPPDTKIVLYKAVFDLLMTYGKRIFTMSMHCNLPVTVSRIAELVCICVSVA